MAEAKYYIEIKDKKVPVILRNYRNSKRIIISFKGNVLNISKPRYISYEKVMKVVKDNEEKIYNQYMDILSLDSKKIKHWYTGEKIQYKGQTFIIERQEYNKNQIEILIEESKKIFRVNTPKIEIEEEIMKKYVDKAVKSLFKNNTEYIIQERLPYWSKKMNIPYKSFKVRDTTSQYGSCKPSTKELCFSSRLIMLPNDKVDAIIVHELSHIIYKNHNKDFYNLVKTYIPNYDEINKWLKDNVENLAI